jgi:hypothetical protein
LFQIFSYVQWLRPLSSSCNYSEPIRKTTKTTVSQVSTSNILPPAPFSFFFLQVIFRCGGSGYFPGVAPVISHGGLGYFPGVAPVIFPRRPGYFPTAALVISHGGFGYFPAAATLIILFWTYFYLYKKICPNNFYFWTYELQISLFMSKFLLNFAVFKHISVVLDLYSHFFGHKILFIPDYVQTPSITSTGLSNIHKLIYCTE